MYGGSCPRLGPLLFEVLDTDGETRSCDICQAVTFVTLDEKLKNGSSTHIF